MNKQYLSKLDLVKFRRSSAQYIEHTPLHSPDSAKTKSLSETDYYHNMEFWMLILGGTIGLLVAFALTAQLQLSLIKLAVLIMIPIFTAYILRKVYLNTLAHLNE